MVNNGDGTFTIDVDRADDRVLRYSETGQYWRHVGTDLVDVDNDGDLDLALGQISGPEYLPHSIVLVNDGTGHYPSRILLPHPAFNGGHTAVEALTHFDVDGDGFRDLLLLHQRDEDPRHYSPHRSYVQVLGQPRPMSFADETAARWALERPRRRNRDNGDTRDVRRRPRRLRRLVVSNGDWCTAGRHCAYGNDRRGRSGRFPPCLCGSRPLCRSRVPGRRWDSVIDSWSRGTNNGPDRRRGTADDSRARDAVEHHVPRPPFAAPGPANGRRRRRGPCRTGLWRQTAPDRDVSRCSWTPTATPLTYTVSSRHRRVVAARAAGRLGAADGGGEGTATIPGDGDQPRGLSPSNRSR